MPNALAVRAATGFAANCANIWPLSSRKSVRKPWGCLLMNLMAGPSFSCRRRAAAMRRIREAEFLPCLQSAAGRSEIHTVACRFANVCLNLKKKYRNELLKKLRKYKQKGWEAPSAGFRSANSGCRTPFGGLGRSLSLSMLPSLSVPFTESICSAVPEDFFQSLSRAQ